MSTLFTRLNPVRLQNTLDYKLEIILKLSMESGSLHTCGRKILALSFIITLKFLIEKDVQQWKRNWENSFFGSKNFVKIQDNSSNGNYSFTFQSLKARILLLIKYSFQQKCYFGLKWYHTVLLFPLWSKGKLTNRRGFLDHSLKCVVCLASL